MYRLSCAIVPVALAALAAPVQAFVFTLTPITNTTSNFAGPILIQGTVSVGPGETFIHPNVMSAQYMPFLAVPTAGFNGSGQNFDPGFLAWNGVGTYTGPIYNHQVSANNLGYSGGMPLGLYASNLIGPGGLSGITLNYVDANGLDHPAFAPHGVNVVPAPGAIGVLCLGGLLAAKRRR